MKKQKKQKEIVIGYESIGVRQDFERGNEDKIIVEIKKGERTNPNEPVMKKFYFTIIFIDRKSGGVCKECGQKIYGKPCWINGIKHCQRCNYNLKRESRLKWKKTTPISSKILRQNGNK